MSHKFSNKTFQYFNSAKRNRKKKAWFDKNRPIYENEVKEPFSELIKILNIEFSGELPKIKINPKKISQPFHRSNRVPKDGSIVKSQSSAYFSEKQTSMFEWNPGLYISIGQSPENCVIGLGVYMASGRQIKAMRNALTEDSEKAIAILENRGLKKRWGELKGEKYVRFPKGFDLDNPAAKYLWHKQFFLSKHLTKQEILSKSFTHQIVGDLRAAMPFLKWIISTVGVYEGSHQKEGKLR